MNRIDKTIGYLDFSWNPVTGCLHQESGVCAVEACYARAKAENRLRGRFGYDEDDPFQPTIHWNRIHEPTIRKKPADIFVCDMGDLWGSWVPAEWINEVLKRCRMCPQHSFFFLTKNPRRYREFEIPNNCWTGTTINKVADIRNRSAGIGSFARNWLSCEPLYEDLSGAGLMDGDFGNAVKGLVVGAQTKPLLLPKREWVDALVAEADKYKISVWLKDNLRSLYPGEKLRQERPGRLGHSESRSGTERKGK